MASANDSAGAAKPPTVKAVGGKGKKREKPKPKDK
jgi:hypothetical protein